MSLYGKYRPQNFANLVGQEHIRQTILNEISNGQLTHAYLFAGPRGTGKTSTSRLIAKALNCTERSPAGEPCDSCEMCTNIRDGNLIDVLEIDAASNRGIDEIRDLKEKIGYAPSRAKTKTYIIDEVHMLTKEAFNALLKTLEEPPESVYFILCTTEIHKIPETIISRCQRFDFKRIDVKTLMTRLNFIAQSEGIAAEDEAIELIARHVEGGMRDAINIFEQLAIDKKLTAEYVRSHLGITGHGTVNSLIDLLCEKELTRSLSLINDVHGEGYDLSSFVRETLECLRERLITGIQKGANDAGKWLTMIEHFEKAREMMRATVIPQLPLEIAVIKLCGAAQMTIQSEPVSKPTYAAPKPTPIPQEKSASSFTPPAMQQSAAPAANNEEIAVAETMKKEFDMERFQKPGQITDNWERVTEKLEPPSTRRSLMQGVVREDGDTIGLQFNSQFHMDIVNKNDVRIKIETIINNLFGRKVTITCFVKQAAPIDFPRPKSREKAPAEVKPEPAKGSAENLAEKAMEMFGFDE